jgi:hypothetical protein
LFGINHSKQYKSAAPLVPSITLDWKKQIELPNDCILTQAEGDSKEEARVSGSTRACNNKTIADPI